MGPPALQVAGVCLTVGPDWVEHPGPRPAAKHAEDVKLSLVGGHVIKDQGAKCSDMGEVLKSPSHSTKEIRFGSPCLLPHRITSLTLYQVCIKI